MPKFVDTLFSGSRFIFWALAPLSFVCAVLISWKEDSWFSTSGLIVVTLDVLVLLLILGLYDPKLFWWAARGATGIVFLAYLAYLADEVASGKPWTPGPRTEDTPFNALRGLVVIGVPCLIYTIRGTFGKKKSR
jgi:hypothetical protein